MTEGAADALLADGLLAASDVPAPGDVVALAASRCGGCGRHEFPARERCPVCGLEMTAVGLSTSPRVAGFTSVSHPPPGAVIDTPYVVVAAAFPEGLSILGPVPNATIDELAIGDTLDSIAIDVGGKVGYGFRIARDSGT